MVITPFINIVLKAKKEVKKNVKYSLITEYEYFIN